MHENNCSNKFQHSLFKILKHKEQYNIQLPNSYNKFNTEFKQMKNELKINKEIFEIPSGVMGNNAIIKITFKYFNIIELIEDIINDESIRIEDIHFEKSIEVLNNEGYNTKLWISKLKELPNNLTLIGLILYSDETYLSISNRHTAKPLIMALSNVKSSINATRKGKRVIAFIPHIKIDNSVKKKYNKIYGYYKKQLYHWCIEKFFEPIKNINEQNSNFILIK